MQRVKIIIKRPTIHYIISLGYILAPLVNILLLLIIIKLPLIMVLKHLFQGYGYLAEEPARSHSSSDHFKWGDETRL